MGKIEYALMSSVLDYQADVVILSELSRGGNMLRFPYIDAVLNIVAENTRRIW